MGYSEIEAPIIRFPPARRKKTQPEENGNGEEDDLILDA
jgi:hypothetical protein